MDKVTIQDMHLYVWKSAVLFQHWHIILMRIALLRLVWLLSHKTGIFTIREQEQCYNKLTYTDSCQSRPEGAITVTLGVEDSLQTSRKLSQR